MTPTLRLLPFEDLPGPTNMAADEVMLEAAAGRGVASLRFYTWAEPTVSLGYFQPAAVRDEVPGLADVAWVRRATGGAAIVHHHELTYSFAVPPGKEWQPPGESWLCRFHHVVQAVLREHGVESHAVICGEEKKLGPVLCFLHQTPGDLLVSGSKAAGSAQRKWKGALLQHGSLLLARSPHAPPLAGVNDFAGRELFTPKSLAAELLPTLLADTGWAAAPGDWTAGERERRAAVQADKYAADEWNRKR